MSKKDAEWISPHFPIQKGQWEGLKRKASQQGYSASFVLRELVAEYLQEDLPTGSPLARYRETYCSDCSCSDACKTDKTMEIRCLLAALTPCRSKLTKGLILRRDGARAKRSQKLKRGNLQR